jgi:hypothetical protein
LTLLNERKSDCILISAEKALGAVNGIKGPETAFRTSFRVAAVNGSENILFFEVRADQADMLYHTRVFPTRGS